MPIIKTIPFGTKIKAHSTEYIVLKHKPEFDGYMQSTKFSPSVYGLQVSSPQSMNEGKVKGKILVYCEETERVNWFSLEDFEFEIVK